MKRPRLWWRRGLAVVTCVAVCGALPGGAMQALADGVGPVSFSVNGMIDPHFDGVPVPGMPLFLPPWMPPPIPVGMGPYPPIRIGFVPPAEGIATARPGDVNDYFLAGVMSEAEVFQSEPDSSLAGILAGPPAGTNNQILKAMAIGLIDYANINALTFGEDFFNGDEDPISGDVDEIWAEYWELRDMYPGFVEPVVTTGGLPITFYFSVDPWAVGLAGTAVQTEATLAGALTLPAGPPGSADEHIPGGPPYSLGPWTSEGEAAGDVYDADPISAPGINNLDHDEAPMALLAPHSADSDMEDDLDALEHVGDNTIFIAGAPPMPAEPGNTHDRVDPTAGINGGIHPPDLGDPFNPNHDPNNLNPVIFSVDRGTYGAPGSAVDVQVLSPVDGASGDLFVAVTIFDFATGGFVTTNMLLIDEGQLGLMPHDDLDAAIVRLFWGPEDLAMRIEEASINYDSAGGSFGYGFTIPLLNMREAVVGFSVDTASIGLIFTAVDFECRVDGAGLFTPGGGIGSGVMEQAGDIFYSDLAPPLAQVAVDPGTGLLYGQNYLWFEEVSIGLDPGAWSLIPPGPIPPSDLADLPDELNALDSLRSGTVPPICDPDFDGDGDVDVNDFLTFSTCFNGALNPPTPICPDLDTDLDGDGDVDVNDFLTFSACFNGALNPPAPACPCFAAS